MNIFFILLGFVIGLYFFRNNIVFSICLSSVFILLCFLRFNKKSNKTLLIILASYLIGIGLPKIPFDFSNGSSIHTGIVIDTKENYFIFLSHGTKYYIYEKENEREIGDSLIVTSPVKEVEFTTYESQFSFTDYLYDKGVSKSLDSYSIEVKYNNPIRLKKCINKFLSNFDEDTKALIDSFLFSRRDYNNHIITLIDEMNLIFLLSMSGIYLSFLLTSLTKLCSRFLKDRYAEAIPFLLLLPYSIFTFPKIGVIRVMSLTLLKYVNKHFLKKRFTYLTIVSSLALFLLLINYHLAYQSGFYIGFGLSLSLIFVRTALSKFKKYKQALFTPLLVYMFMLPVTCLSGGAFHPFGLLFQTIFIPFNEIFIIFSLISFYVGYPFRIILSNLTNVLKLVYHGFYKMDFAIPMADYFKYFIFVYYVLYFLFIYYLESNRCFHLKRSYIPLVSILVISMIPIQRYIVNAVYFINVGQGDSILIQNRQNIVMIDTGGNTSFDMAKETLIPFMKKKQINHVDLLITTHNDADHAGAASSLMQNFNVKNYYNNRNFYPVQIGDIYLENLNTYDASDENGKSLVFNIDFMGKKWLLTGDASIEVEKDMIAKGVDLDCDILKVGHHGSNTSTCEEFILASSPDEAIISVGKRNSYHHPSKEVIQRLTSHNIKIRQTCDEGTISYIQLFT